MTKMIFVNLPVADVAKSTAFYEAIGFEKNAQFSAEHASSMMWTETITIMLVGHDFYRTLTTKPIADTKGTSAALIALGFDSRAEVDAITEAAIAAGGREAHDPEDLGFMYSRAFEDFDGHGFGPFHMDLAAAVAAMAQSEAARYHPTGRNTMSDLPRITTFKWVPPFARGFVRDLRARWAFEEVGQSYEVDLIDGPYAKSPQHRRSQPFGQVPTYLDGKVEIFESGAIVLRIAGKGKGLLPDDADARLNAIQWLISALNSVEPWVMQVVVVDVFEADKPWSLMRRPRVIADLEGRLADLEAALGDRTWLDGEAFTVGDLMMISVLGGLRKTDILQAYPRLAAYVARGEARPAHVKAMGDQLALYEAADAPEEMSA